MPIVFFCFCLICSGISDFCFGSIDFFIGIEFDLPIVLYLSKSCIELLVSRASVVLYSRIGLSTSTEEFWLSEGLFIIILLRLLDLFFCSVFGSYKTLLRLNLSSLESFEADP